MPNYVPVSSNITLDSSTSYVDFLMILTAFRIKLEKRIFYVASNFSITNRENRFQLFYLNSKAILPLKMIRKPMWFFFLCSNTIFWCMWSMDEEPFFINCNYLYFIHTIMNQSTVIVTWILLLKVVYGTTYTSSIDTSNRYWWYIYIDINMQGVYFLFVFAAFSVTFFWCYKRYTAKIPAECKMWENPFKSYSMSIRNRKNAYLYEHYHCE